MLLRRAMSILSLGALVLGWQAAFAGSAGAASGWTAYVANEGSNTVTPFSTATNTVGTPIPVGTNPGGVAITPDGETLYVANSGSGTVTPINTATNTPGAPIAVGARPWGLAITPDGKTVYIANGDGRFHRRPARLRAR